MARMMKKIVNAEEMSVRFVFNNGKEFTALYAEYPEHIKNMLGLHGVRQKLGDTCAGKDEAEWLTEIENMNTRLRNGDWGAERGSGLEEKLEAAEDRVVEYDKMSDDEKRAVAKLGVSRLALVKEVDKVKKAIAKRDKED